ncbi:glutamyl-tRNA reductase [Marinicella pacifica]|uniref:Glutamyl-tRNA reductase n=1 Tax=Marinicella pacifica TaxID=1171543 RepID=A0A917FNJ3_9GAMM|nr:glutamyl-tRNA reductase [Marinicella pacifica]GGF91324.1 glutamyl-tRNA reductase [Marinicella pacifica]
MSICLFGVNHKTADIAIRERFTVAESDYRSHIQETLSHPAIRAVVILSTCNRTEYYLSVSSVKAFEDFYENTFGRQDNRDVIYKMSGQAVVNHLFAVTAGIDSLVVGETQIQGQVKKAYETARQVRMDSALDKLFQMAFKAAKLVRSETEIGRNPVSVAHCAVQLGRQIFGDLQQQKLLVVGAGETSELVIRYLMNHQADTITLTNRTRSKAEKMARIFNTGVMPLADLNRRLGEFDLIFTATACPHHLITHAAAKQALVARKHRPMVMIDLSVPRDIDDSIKALDDVFLYAVDDLQKVITQNMSRRQNTVEEARRIIEAEATLFMQWQQRKKYHGLLKQYQHKVDHDKVGVLEKKQGDVDEMVLQKMEILAHQVSQKIAHPIMQGLRKVIESGNEEHIKLMAELLDLEIENDTRN